MCLYTILYMQHSEIHVYLVPIQMLSHWFLALLLYHEIYNRANCFYISSYNCNFIQQCLFKIKYSSRKFTNMVNIYHTCTQFLLFHVLTIIISDYWQWKDLSHSIVSEFAPCSYDLPKKSEKMSEQSNTECLKMVISILLDKTCIYSYKNISSLSVFFPRL